MGRSLLLVIATLGLVGCGSSTPLSLQNQSGVLLQSVVVSGSGFTKSLGNLEPGATVTAKIRPHGESALAVSFVASGKRITLPPEGYFEGGGSYAVAVVVTPDLRASVDSRLRPY
jgi:hypothetical protein